MRFLLCKRTSRERTSDGATLRLSLIFMNSSVDPLSCTWAQFSAQSGLPLSARLAAFTAWLKARTENGLLSFDRRLVGAPSPWATVRERNGDLHEGLNFVSSDYLGLATHAQVKQAAQFAIHRYGTHSAGTAALAGTHDSALGLCEGLAHLVGLPDISLHPSGWMAGYGALRALVRAGDVVLLDEQAGNGLREGARHSTPRVQHYRHLDIDHLEHHLQRLRARKADDFILVATPSLFATDGATVDLAALRSVCRTYDAVTLVDMAHDLGCIGPGGTGEAGLQGVTGDFDIVIGSLAKTFASVGGFVATARADLGDYLRAYSPPRAFSSALSPAHLAAASAALHLVRSSEGAARRAALQRASVALRAALSQHHFTLAGAPGPIVQVPIGSERDGRRVAQLCAERGLLVTLLESPLVARNACALRLQIMAGHEPALLPDVARHIAESVALVGRDLSIAAAHDPRSCSAGASAVPHSSSWNRS